MKLTNKQLKHLKSTAHALKPVIRVGQHGVTEALLKELDLSLTHHELLKVKVPAAKETRDATIESLCVPSGAICVQRLGNVAVLFRPNKKASAFDLSLLV